MRSWADVLGAHDELYLEAASPSLLAAPPPDPRLRLTRLAEPYAAPPTPAYVYPTNPAPAPGFEPLCEADIIGAEAWLRVVQWESQQWNFIVDCARLGPAARRRLKPLVITAASFDPRGRGTIWDLRDHRPGQPILPLDFDQPIRTRFDTNFLAHALSEYPDRELVSFVCHGVALKTESAPPDLVLCPHLVSQDDPRPRRPRRLRPRRPGPHAAPPRHQPGLHPEEGRHQPTHL